MSDDDQRRGLSRRQLLILSAAGGVSAMGVGSGLDADGEDGTLYGGKMALSQAFNVAGDLWVGPDSAKSGVSADSGRMYFASDTQLTYYGDGGSWVSLGVGTSGNKAPASHFQSLSTDDIGSKEGPWQHADASQYDGATGADKIQAAHDALDGNRVVIHVPPNGPDDGVTAGDGSTLDNVWEIDKDVTFSKDCVRLVGSMMGGDNPERATQLVQTADVALKFTGQFLNSVERLYVDGGETATNNVIFGVSGTHTYDYRMHRAMLQHSTGTGLVVQDTQNVWIEACYFERVGGYPVSIKPDSGSQRMWLTDNMSVAGCGGFVRVENTGQNLDQLLLRDNYSSTATSPDVQINGPVETLKIFDLEYKGTEDSSVEIAATPRRLFIGGLSILDPDNHGIEFSDGRTIAGSIYGCSIDGCGQATANTYDAIHYSSLDTTFGLKIFGNALTGRSSTTRYGINNSSQKLDDSKIFGNRIGGMGTAKYNNLPDGDNPVDWTFRTALGGAAPTASNYPPGYLVEDSDNAGDVYFITHGGNATQFGT